MINKATTPQKRGSPTEREKREDQSTVTQTAKEIQFQTEYIKLCKTQLEALHISA